MYKPIPKKLLIHNIEIRKKPIPDKWGNSNEPRPTKINNVRIEPINKQVLSNTNTQVTLSALLFYDIKNSSPHYNFTVGDEVTFNNQKYTVETIEPIYTNKLHHLEIGLKI